MARILCTLLLFIALSSQAVAEGFIVTSCRLGVEALQKNDLDGAIGYFSQVIQLDPKNVVALSNRGLAYARKLDYNKAIDDFTDAIRCDPKHPQAFGFRGACYVSLGMLYGNKNDFDKALADCNEAIRRDPTNAFTFANRGNAYAYKMQHDKAIDDFTEAIRLDPTYPNAFFLRGIAYGNTKQFVRAIDDLTEATRLNPKYTAAYGKLAWCLSVLPTKELRDGKRAVELATKACDLCSWDPSSLDILACAYAECGDFKNAVKYQKKAIALGMDNEEHQKRLKLYEDGKPYRYDSDEHSRND